ncbi:MAG: SDR family oxidoreductase [Actinomycetota bacterium]|nr:MAG: SDR family oxidoreductase [Actinomycetota bacterium]
MDTERLAGRTALVTGAASGIGAATARRLAAEGAQVVVSDVNNAAGEAVAAELDHDRLSAAYVALDVRDETQWRHAIAATVRLYGGLDILVNNAGAGDLATIEDTTVADWDNTIAVDQTSVFLGMREAAAELKRSGHASVVNVSSIFAAGGGFGTSPAYHAAKGAIRVLTKNAALHWATAGIRVNSVHPGFIDTPLLDQARGTPVEEAMISMTPMGRLGKPAEVAAVIAFLAGDDAAFVTGAEFYVDGGFTAV